MMSRNLFGQRIYQKWANHFHLDREALHRMETLLLPEARLTGSNVIAIWYIGQCLAEIITPGPLRL